MRNVRPWRDYPSGSQRVAALARRWGLQPKAARELQHFLFLHPHCRLTSGRRGRLHNASVGGSPTSYHLEGRAGDVIGPAEDLAALRRHARATGAVEVLDEGDHTHVAW